MHELLWTGKKAKSYVALHDHGYVMGGIDGEKHKDSKDYAGARFEELWGRIRFWSALWASVFSELGVPLSLIS